MHPVLVATLAEDRCRRCPCGEVTQQFYHPYRNWRHGHHLELQDSAATPLLRASLGAGQIWAALSFSSVLSLLQTRIHE